MAVQMLQHLIFALLGVVALTILVHAQSQSGFISIDCGIPENSGYTDKITGINYTSDAAFIETGVNYNISPEYNTSTLEQQFLNVRSFPEGVKHCYTLKPGNNNNKFLIRARFMYGNYDGKGKLPSFDIVLEADVWDSVELEDASTIVTKEIIHIPQKNFVYVCLVNKGSGAPFISALELRPLTNSTYETESGSLILFQRWDVGSITNNTFRYRDDVYDRIWAPSSLNNVAFISNGLKVESLDDYLPPSTVMQTAVVPANCSNSLKFGWKPKDPESRYYAYFYFAELEDNQGNQTREMTIYINGRTWYGPDVFQYLYANTIYSTIPITDDKIEFSVNTTRSSKLPPILNALEIYQAKEFPQSLTDSQDVEAIMNIKSKYRVKRNWQGDPCGPKAYLWEGLNCKYNDDGPPSIISLNLSSGGLAGEISPFISSLRSIQILDLSNNNLTGPVPDFLSHLSFLTELNLGGNKLKGSVPGGIMEKKKNGLLSLSVDGNPDLCPDVSCTRRKKFIVPLVVAVVAFSIFLTAIAILWRLKRMKQVRKKKGSLTFKNQRFTYSDLVGITNNFDRVLGKGGFGTVYHGYLDDIQVAVKILSASSVQGFKQFQAEVELLMRVHHKNMTALIGYCDEGTNMGLIYEFMENGNLQEHLSEDANILSWEGRLRIATEAAKGLEYLHSGCKPPIVHRDVKSRNILLNENFQAKLADFGLSRTFPVEDGTHVSTNIAGTPGYLDPEYCRSNWLTEKSDVYSFGVVIFEIITGRPVIEDNSELESTHISDWVSSMVAEGEVKNIVDKRLQGNFDINSAWKAVEISMACVSPTSAKRPTMNQVLMELNEALAIEIARKKVGQETKSNDSIISVN